MQTPNNDLPLASANRGGDANDVVDLVGKFNEAMEKIDTGLVGGGGGGASNVEAAALFSPHEQYPFVMVGAIQPGRNRMYVDGEPTLNGGSSGFLTVAQDPSDGEVFELTVPPGIVTWPMFETRDYEGGGLDSPIGVFLAGDDSFPPEISYPIKWITDTPVQDIPATHPQAIIRAGVSTGDSSLSDLSSYVSVFSELSNPVVSGVCGYTFGGVEDDPPAPGTVPDNTAPFDIPELSGVEGKDFFYALMQPWTLEGDDVPEGSFSIYGYWSVTINGFKTILGLYWQVVTDDEDGVITANLVSRSINGGDWFSVLAENYSSANYVYNSDVDFNDFYPENLDSAVWASTPYSGDWSDGLILRFSPNSAGDGYLAAWIDADSGSVTPVATEPEVVRALWFAVGDEIDVWDHIPVGMGVPVGEFPPIPVGGVLLQSTTVNPDHNGIFTVTAPTSDTRLLNFTPASQAPHFGRNVIYLSSSRAETLDELFTSGGVLGSYAGFFDPADGYSFVEFSLGGQQFAVTPVYTSGELTDEANTRFIELRYDFTWSGFQTAGDFNPGDKLLVLDNWNNSEFNGVWTVQDSGEGYEFVRDDRSYQVGDLFYATDMQFLYIVDRAAHGEVYFERIGGENYKASRVIVDNRNNDAVEAKVTFQANDDNDYDFSGGSLALKMHLNDSNETAEFTLDQNFGSLWAMTNWLGDNVNFGGYAWWSQGGDSFQVGFSEHTWVYNAWVEVIDAQGDIPVTHWEEGVFTEWIEGTSKRVGPADWESPDLQDSLEWMADQKVRSVFSLLTFDLDSETAEALLAPGPNPYPVTFAILNQTTNPGLNGIWQGQTGRPGTTGNQAPSKIADLPEGEAIIIGVQIADNPAQLDPSQLVMGTHVLFHVRDQSDWYWQRYQTSPVDVFGSLGEDVSGIRFAAGFFEDGDLQSAEWIEVDGLPGLINTPLPEPDGTYVLQVTISEGEPTYEWVEAT